MLKLDHEVTTFAHEVIERTKDKLFAIKVPGSTYLTGISISISNDITFEAVVANYFASAICGWEIIEDYGLTSKTADRIAGTLVNEARKKGGW